MQWGRRALWSSDAWLQRGVRPRYSLAENIPSPGCVFSSRCCFSGAFPRCSVGVPGGGSSATRQSGLPLKIISHWAKNHFSTPVIIISLRRDFESHASGKSFSRVGHVGGAAFREIARRIHEFGVPFSRRSDAQSPAGAHRDGGGGRPIFGEKVTPAPATFSIIAGRLKWKFVWGKCCNGSAEGRTRLWETPLCPRTCRAKVAKFVETFREIRRDLELKFKAPGHLIR